MSLETEAVLDRRRLRRRASFWRGLAILAIVVISYVLILPQLYKRVARVRAWVDALAIPVPRPMHALVYILAYAIVALVHSKRGHGELLELTGCVLFLLIVLYPANRPVFLPKTVEG